MLLKNATRDFVQYMRSLHFKHRQYISTLEHVMKLILNSYVLLASINTIHKYCARLSNFVKCGGSLFEEMGCISHLWNML